MIVDHLETLRDIILNSRHHLKSSNELIVSGQLVAALYSHGGFLTPRKVTSHCKVSNYFALPPLYP